MFKKFLVVVGIVSFVLGSIGVVVPLLPTTPFLLLSGYCFAKGSEKFDRWLKGTKIYQTYIGDYLETRTISMEKKIKIILNIYVLMGFSIYVVPIPQVKLGLFLMTIIQTIVLFFFVPTPESKESKNMQKQKGYSRK